MSGRSPARVAGFALALGTLLAVAPLATPAGATVLGMGAQAYRSWGHGENGWGSTLALGFDAEDVRQFSERLHVLDLGLVLRFTRVDLDELARVQGGEILVRRRWLLEDSRWRLFAGLGGGFQEVDFAGTPDERVVWNATLEGGLELLVGPILRVELGLLTRSIELSPDSYTGTAIALSLGTRIDS